MIQCFALIYRNLYQVGSPQGFGSAGAKLVLKKSNGEIVDEKEFSLANDGES